MSSSSLVLALASLLPILFIWFRKPKASRASLPPGPKPFPLLGNISDLTMKELWLPAFHWAKKYGTCHCIIKHLQSRLELLSPGDVVYLHVLGQSIIILNTPEAAGDLMDKRGSIYSDKPSFVMVGELWVFPFVSFCHVNGLNVPTDAAAKTW